jgi:signal transduction histidine kinase
MPRLVVIDDEQVFCETLRDNLELEGFEVRTATDGPTGLALIREWQPDLVLCDLHMQGQSGHDVLRVLRQDSLTASVPVVFLTGDSADATQRATMEMGADDFLQKPFRGEELLRAIHARLARRQQIHQDTERRLAEMRASISHSVPHEFLTPLTAVLALSSLLVDEGPNLPPDTAHDAAAAILAAGRRLHRLVEKFLLFNELEMLFRGADAQARQVGLRPSANPAAVVDEAATQIAALCERTADLQTSTSSASSVRMSRDHLAALVMELVENACTFSDAGTPVRIAASQSGDDFLLTVQDHGRGMTREQVERLGAFVQFDRQHMEQAGTGLGLAIVTRIVELAGGAVRVEGSPGEGTTVTVRIPTAGDNAAPSP